MKLNLTKEWCIRMADCEGNSEIGAGFESFPASYNFRYRNHRGEEGLRRVIPMGVRLGATEWHPKQQWLLRAFDIDKNAEREFAMADIIDVQGNSTLMFGPGYAAIKRQSNAG